jgi:hypothetical protein
MRLSGFFGIQAWLAAFASFASPPEATLVEVRRISDQAPHSAFTDLAHWKNQFVCAFREGRRHVSTDGKIRILTSPDGSNWKSVAVVSLDDYDLRDAGLSESPNGRLMLIGGASPRAKDNESAPTGTFVAFSDDGGTWSKPQIVQEPGRWLWRVTWRDGKAYGVSYPAGSEDRSSELLVSDDGLKYRMIVAWLLGNGRPTESVLRFDDKNRMICLMRRDGPAPSNTAMLSVSEPPYNKWQWHDLKLFFGGPNFIRAGDWWIAAGRIFRDAGTRQPVLPGAGSPKTEIAWLDVENKSLTPILQLPSGGDTSYPGLVWRDGRLWVSYYSSHEGKASIYLAKVALRGDSSKTLAADQTAACERLGLDASAVEELVEKPLYKFTESEVDTYLRFLSATEPDLRKRIMHLARKNIGQPYEIYLLGEMPFEPYDPQPMYCLGKSDCVVFAEQTYAMALSHNWPSFMKMLQRLRYRDGRIGVVTRNHYTEADWNVSNRWLVDDITAELAGDSAVKFQQSIDRAQFFKNRYKLSVDIPIERHEDVYLPFEEISRVKGKLRDGDFVNVVRGIVKPGAAPDETFGGTAFVGHVGLVAEGDDGEVQMFHSSEPRVREEPLAEYIRRQTADLAERDAAGKARLVGFKFLRLRDDPLKHLERIDGADAPRVTLPDGGEAKF